jgi:oxygen-dependent protoporphyrinogen oxidase
MMRAIVIGGGISGIAAAARLVAKGFTTRILESETTLGGRMGVRRDGTTEVDLGGRNFSSGDTRLIELLATLGITEFSRYDINSVSIGTSRPFDMRSGGDVPTRLRRALRNAISASPFDLLRLRRVVRGARSEPESGIVGGPYWARLAEENEDPAATSFFGRTVADHVLRPWTLRMMAAEPEEVYLGNLGPLLGRAPGSLKRVQGGMGVVARAVLERFDVKLGHAARRVVVTNGRVVGVDGVTLEGAAFHERADVVVIATPANLAAEMLAALPTLALELRQIIYRPVATVVAEYSDVQFPRGAGGLVLPRGHALSHVAKYDASNRVRFSFAGVAARRAMIESSIEQLADLGERTFGEVGGQLGRRVSFTGNVWRPGLCGQTWMHHRTVESLLEQGKLARGLGLTGDYFRGNSLEACVIAAEENVDRLLLLEGGAPRRVGAEPALSAPSGLDQATSRVG